MKHRHVSTASITVGLMFAALFGAAVPRPIRAAEAFTPWHVARLRLASSPVPSPHGRYIAYVLHVPRDPLAGDSGPGWSELHVVYPDGASRPFITGEVSIGSVDWLPDGSAISFLSKRGDDKLRSLYAIPIDGGEARKVLEFAADVSGYSFSPDGARVALLATEEQPKEVKESRDKGFNQEVYEEDSRTAGVFIATLAGEGEGEAPRKLELPGSPSELVWAPAGNRLALALAPTPHIDDWYMKRKVHVIDIDSAEVLARFENPGKLGKIAWNPDGKHLAFLSGEDINDPSEGRLMVVPADGGELQQVLLGVEGDFTDLAWKDAETIVYLAAVGVTSRIGEVRPASGEHTVLLPEGSMVLASLALARGGETLVLLGESPHHPNEVFAMSAGNERPFRLTDSNPWLADMRFAPQEVVKFNARDGLELEGILVRPLDEEEGKRYPLILTVHGGPESHIPNGWQTYYSRPGQVGAAQGFAVFSPNYRGSTGRGVAFSKLGQADYAGKEFDDLVDAVDHLVETGVVDRERVGITGGSYGGYASAWGATYHTERFAASVMFVGISDLISKAGTTDIPNEMELVHARKRLYENWQWYLERSPIYYAEQARTPILILHGKEDPRVHPSQSLELYRHLRILGNVPVRLVFYPGEGHGNRNSAARLDYNLRMMRWFEHYLEGEGGDPPPHELEHAPPADEDGAEKEV